jgi:predicted nucleic acid-binding protein
MNPVFLDTSGVIALLHSGDAHHARAVRLADQFARSDEGVVRPSEDRKSSFNGGY